MRVFSIALTAAAAALLGLVALVAEANLPGPQAAQGEETILLVPRGAGVSAIGRQLEAEGIIRSALSFRVAHALFAGRRPLQAGEYAIPERASVRQVIETLARGKVLLHPITIPEGLTSAQVVRILAAHEALTGPVPMVPPEGEVLPDTYKIARGAEREVVLAQMMAAQDRLLDELWPNRAAGLPIASPQEALILASIVEKETGLAEERPQVAAVFTNRLRRGMRLESDPTIIYGISQGEPLGRGLFRSEIDRPTAYNTYVIPGLPPTPIANPGREAIAAVLNPPKTQDLFFVALSPDNPREGHVFSKTYAEHQRAVARLRAAERARAAP